MPCVYTLLMGNPWKQAGGGRRCAPGQLEGSRVEGAILELVAVEVHVDQLPEAGEIVRLHLGVSPLPLIAKISGWPLLERGRLLLLYPQDRNDVDADDRIRFTTQDSASETLKETPLTQHSFPCVRVARCALDGQTKGKSVCVCAQLGSVIMCCPPPRSYVTQHVGCVCVFSLSVCVCVCAVRRAKATATFPPSRQGSLTFAFP